MGLHLPVVLGSPFLDEVAIFRRSRNPLGGLTVELVTDRKAEAAAVFYGLTQKKMDHAEKEAFGRDCAEVLQWMRDRQAPEATIEAFFQKASQLKED